jgi:hypothetical protein
MTLSEFHNGIQKLFAEAMKSRLSIEEIRSMINELLDEAEEAEERNPMKTYRFEATREVSQTAIIEVEAETPEAAVELAQDELDGLSEEEWDGEPTWPELSEPEELSKKDDESEDDESDDDESDDDNDEETSPAAGAQRHDL